MFGWIKTFLERRKAKKRVGKVKEFVDIDDVEALIKKLEEL